MRKAAVIIALLVLMVFLAPTTRAIGEPTWIISPDGIAILWTANFESDLDGYDVYRAGNLEGPMSKLNAELIPEAAYLDTSVVEGESYWYWLIAVDSCGNMSELSLPSGEAIQDLTKPVPVTGFQATVNACSGEVVLAWDAHLDPHFKQFYLLQGPTINGPFTEIYAGTENTWDDIRENGTVYYRVLGEDQACWLSDPVTISVDVVSDTEPPAVPAAPHF